MTARTAVASGDWSAHVTLVFSRLDERHRRWVGGRLSDVLGRGGTKQLAALAGLDPQTIRQGRIDLKRQLRTSDSLEKNGHSLCPWQEQTQGGMSLRRT
jgi:hypothetical protein